MQALRLQTLSRTLWPNSQQLLLTVFAASNLLQFVHYTTATSSSSASTTCASSNNRNYASTCQSSSMSEPANDTYEYTTGSSSVAFVTTPDEKLAKKLAQGLVEQKLAACVNIIPTIQSIYMWEGKVNEDNECLMMIKTRTSRVDELIRWVRENHSYSVAEVITLPIEKGNVPYLSWIAQTVPDKK